MNPIDLVIIVTVLIGFVLGFKDGFVRKLIGLIGFGLAIITAVLFKKRLGAMVEYAFGIEYYLAEIVAGIAIFFGIILIFTFLKRIIHPFDKVNNLINQIIGGVVGVVQLLYFLSAVFLLLNVFNIPSKSTRSASAFYEDTYQVIPVTIEFLNNYTPKTEEILKDYINEKDSTDDQ
ncbi:colicin V production protein [bacterium BMS3Abin03]|nr:colicin V production protein [bacterium BMS3Abin03]